MRDTVFVFARAPRLGTVKRRLAREVGTRAALDFHRRTMIGLLRRLRCAPGRAIVLAVTPDRARFPLPLPTTRIGQGTGGLGARMKRALDRVRHGRAIIIGCDIPEAGAADIRDAFRALGRADAVFGPAEDGGYWLVGLGPRRPARPFSGVRWSSPHALADTLRNFAGRRVVLLRRLRDVDIGVDLRSLRRCRN
jgi:rSAM/selenodomain-associated transferase 1